MAALRIGNRDARRLWLHTQGLSATPTGQLDVLGIIRRLGLVQLDSIRAVSRAHHHILWSRNQNYREPMLNRLLARDRSIFEHFTHDASVLPMEFYPMWTRQFRRLSARIEGFANFRTMPGPSERDAIKARIAQEGALSTKAFETRIEGAREMWARPPHKRALDYMWYAGELSTCHRVNFTKFYDLSERVIPDHHRQAEMTDEAQVAWLCENALDRLSVGTPGEIMRFWEATTPKEVRGWIDQAELVGVEIEGADKSWTKAFAPADIETRLATVDAPTSRLRILNPFDPVIRDRDRLKRLFGFDYRIEIFVPAAKRRWGYYVFPLLEGDRFVGRLDAKADRSAGVLNILNFWPEEQVKWTGARAAKLYAELDRLARFIGVERVVWVISPPG